MKKHETRPTIFQFRKFAVSDDRCAMKVGTDAVLLGAWVDVANAKRILDIGTGSGVIALMLAQRTKDSVNIDAVEIEKADADQAMENISRSPWPKKVMVHHRSVQEFNPPECYDLIVSNPPYFIKSLLPPAASRAQARHTKNLTFEDLIDHAARLLHPAGRLAVVLPFHEGNKFQQLASTKGLVLRRQLAFYSRREKPQERWLYEFALSNGLIKKEKLILYESGQTKTSDYVRLTKDFYL